jgi:hypothetical protein
MERWFMQLPDRDLAYFPEGNGKGTSADRRRFFEVAGRLHGMNRADKRELLFQQGIDFDTLPTWQKRGFGLDWRERQIVGVNGELD